MFFVGRFLDTDGRALGRLGFLLIRVVVLVDVVGGASEVLEPVTGGASVTAGGATEASVTTSAAGAGTTGAGGATGGAGVGGAGGVGVTGGLPDGPLGHEGFDGW